MVTIFNVNFEFNKDEVINTIIYSVNQNKRGYVYVIDGNVLTNANKRNHFQNIINNSIVNTGKENNHFIKGYYKPGQN